MTSYRLLCGGYRSTYTLFRFNALSKQIKVISESRAPDNASWIEPASDGKDGAASKTFYSVAENDDGKVVSLKLEGDNVSVTSERDTRGAAPCHVHVMKDKSGIVVANYMGGSIIYFPTQSGLDITTDSASPVLKFPLVYAQQNQTPPDPERQEASHCHQVVEGEGGALYVPDLGNDRVWIVWRGGDSGLSVKGWCQCPPGSGPRHAVFSKDGKYLYVLTELSNSLFTFSLSDPTYPIIPHPRFGTSILPPSVPSAYHKKMNAAELIAHPSLPLLYASNRLELDLSKSTDGQFTPTVPGDTVAIATLSTDGAEITDVKQVRTGCNAIRAMRLSPDAQFVAIAGQNGGGVEIYSVGEDGKSWDLVAKDEGLQSITDIVWL